MNNDPKELLALEHRFWTAMRNKDGDAAAALTDETSIVAGAQGASSITPAMMTKMTGEGKWTLESYKFDEAKAQTRFISDDVALIAYHVTETITVEGKELTIEANDTSVWVRRDGGWRCAMHTESLAGDPFGRDKAPAK